MKYSKLYIATLALAFSAGASACSDDKEYFGAPAIKQPLPKEVYVEGTVICESGPLANVVVSDGCNITTTDGQGKYILKSELPYGYVFASTPSGYEPATFIDSRPKFWQMVDKRSPTGVDFQLRATDNKPLAIITMADPQISNRCGDAELMKTMYAPEVNRAIDSLRNIGSSPIVITQGDIICDYFVANGYGYTLARFNEDFAVKAPVYHTMGNHDNDPFIEGDITGSSTWHITNGPSYYSFNRGGAHFIIVDNIIYENVGAGNGISGNRHSVTGITETQLKWIEKDLATIQDKNAPLFISMHAPFLTYPEAEDVIKSKVYRFENGGPQLGALLKDFTQVRIFSGHSHNAHFEQTPEGNIREYNYAGANGGWWPAGFSPYEPNFPVCHDGAPWGIGIWNFSGNTPTHVFKGFNKPVDYQIRAYDLNTMTINDRDLANIYYPGNAANTNVVLANVWSYEPGATVKMFENGVELKVKRVKTVDPYFIRNYLEPLKQARGKLHSGHDAHANAHLFRAQAATATAPVTIEFTDRYGRKFTTVLNRPGATDNL